MGDHGDNGVPLILLVLDDIMTPSVLSANTCLALDHPWSVVCSLHP